MIVNPFPHYEINVIDESAYTPVPTEALPLHVPIFPMKTQKGPIGIPVYHNSIADARRIHGTETFEELNTTYYSPSSAFLNRVFRNQGAYIVRLADEETAVESWAILEVGVVHDLVTQYQKDAYGNWILDESGDPIPEDDGMGGDVEEAGIHLTWQLRTALEVGEDFDALEPRTVIDGATTTVWYPIMTFKSTSPGVWGDSTAFQLWYDTDQNDASRVARAGALYFNFAATQQETGGSGVDPIRDKYGNIFNSAVLKPDVIDEAIVTKVSLNDVLDNAFNPDDGFELPYTIKVYSENIELVGEAIRVVEVNRVDMLETAWYVNPVSVTDLEGKPYDHVILTEASIPMIESVNHYLDNGADGDITDTSIESLYVDFLELTMNPDIVDSARYPFTHIYDIGWSIDVKYAICDFLATRDDIKVVLATQVVTDVDGTPTYNTQAVDNSIGSALRARCLLIPESIEKGTGACRADIFQQAGLLAEGNYSGMLPFTIWYAEKLSLHNNTDRMRGEPAGLPNSLVSIFKSWNWTPASKVQKSLSWDAGLNYVQYADRSRIHYPALHSVYLNDSSVLSISDFTNAIIYLKHAARKIWAKYAGVTMPAADLYALAVNDMNSAFGILLNDRYTFNVSMYQTDEEARLGYVHHVRINLTSPANNRVWSIDIHTLRENFEG